MPNILVDGIHISENMQGVGRYVINIIERLAGYDNSFKYLVLLTSGIPKKFLPSNKNIKYKIISWKNHLWHGLVTLPYFVRKNKIDAALIPYDASLICLKIPYLIISHGVADEIQSAINYLKIKRSFHKMIVNKIDKFFMPYAFNHASIIFSNSAYVAQRLKNNIIMSEKKIRIAYCAPASDFNILSESVNKDHVRMKLNSPKGYILYFNTGDEWENFSIVLKVYDEMVQKNIIYPLVIAGVKERNSEIVKKAVADFPYKENIRIVPFIKADNVEKLAEIYSAALLYLDLSLYEGFGMQIVEAMACGIPVICSNRGALPEVTGGCAVLVNPLNVNEVTEAIVKVANNRELRKSLVEKGRNRAAFFSWDKTARSIFNGLKEVVENGKS